VRIFLIIYIPGLHSIYQYDTGLRILKKNCTIFVEEIFKFFCAELKIKSGCFEKHNACSS